MDWTEQRNPIVLSIALNKTLKTKVNDRLKTIKNTEYGNTINSTQTWWHRLSSTETMYSEVYKFQGTFRRGESRKINRGSRWTVFHYINDTLRENFDLLVQQLLWCCLCGWQRMTLLTLSSKKSGKQTLLLKIFKKIGVVAENFPLEGAEFFGGSFSF